MAEGSEIPPCQTLYCRNLNDQIHENDLIANLYEFFIPFGEVLAVNAIMSQKMRGQAFVSLKDVASATVAMRRLQGKEFLGKPIVIQFAKTKTDAVAILDGAPRNKKRKVDEKPQI